MGEIYGTGEGGETVAAVVLHVEELPSVAEVDARNTTKLSIHCFSGQRDVELKLKGLLEHAKVLLLCLVKLFTEGVESG
ncbi:hypothetical protein QOT17_024957 [Balamuthia mandrillaris]